MRRSISLLLVAFAALLFSGSAQAAPGAIFTCQATGQVGNVDPIVSPGQVSAHPHQFYGGGPVDLVETSASLRQKPTTCVEKDNHSAFWMPTVEQGGVRLAPTTSKHALLYYRCRHNSSTCRAMERFPENFGQVEGNANASSASENPVFNNGLGGWRCGTGGGSFSAVPPACPGGVLVASMTFGNCLYPDGSMTMHTNSNCTMGGGQPVVRIQQYFRFRALNNTAPITIGGGHPPYRLHSDYLFGWNVPAFENFLDRCIRALVNCGKNPSV